MTTLQLETLEIPAAGLDAPSPHCTLEPAEQNVLFDDSIPAEDRVHANYGCNYSRVPYRAQDGYDRVRRPARLRTAILENAHLRACFLLEHGGRLWSLIDKRRGRELLYVNPVFQPGNLALRGAWFSGGVEWNMGMPAHSPFTCSPPFFGVLRDARRGPVLRMWEWERIRACPYQVDFYLPPDSHLLHVRCTLTNPNADTVPAYWFSNIAAALSKGVRVVVPADHAYSSGYTPGGYGLLRFDIPVGADGIDVSYPVNSPRARDYFYRVDAGRLQPWIAAPEADGAGLFQASTRRLKGRKLFIWGTGPGGERWQEFLSTPGHPYFEIQAGLGRTQAECVPLGAGERAEWLEVYGMMEADSAAVHGADWARARAAVEEAMPPAARLQALEDELSATQALAGRAPDDVIQHGSGWGALEQQRRAAAGMPPVCGASILFGDDDIGPDERPWKELLDRGVMTPANGTATPGDYSSEPAWIGLLEDSLRRPGGDNWLSRLHLGVLYHANGNAEKAQEHWLLSAGQTATPYAWRNLAVASLRAKRMEEACARYDAAWRLDKGDWRIAVEYLDVLLDAQAYDAMDAVFASMPEEAAAKPRCRVARVRQAYALERLEEAENLLDTLVLPDLREGDTALTDLWFRIQARKAATKQGIPCDDALLQQIRKDLIPPAHLDFRMA